MTAKHPRRRLVAKIAATVMVAAALATAVWWQTVVAQLRAIVVVATLLEVPVLEPAVDAVTGEPQQDEIELDGLATRLYRPSGSGPWPAVLFITGADAAGRESEDIRILGRALARAGYVTIVPDIPGLASGVVGRQSIDDVERAVVAAGEHESVEGERVALASVSAGASLALLAAARPAVARRVSIVAGIAPFARVRTILQIATTGGYVARDGSVERYEAAPYLRRAVTTSLLDAARRTGAASGDGGAVQRLLDNDDPRRFGALYEALPEQVRMDVELLSPLRRAENIDVPIELAAPPRDLYFPLAESQVLVAAAPDARLTVTGVLEHARPSPGLGDLGDLLAFNGFVVRVLRTAAR